MSKGRGAGSSVRAAAIYWLAWRMSRATIHLPMSSPEMNTVEMQALRAVFLSYAREDTASAQRIADALRSHGVEVWLSLIHI